MLGRAASARVKIRQADHSDCCRSLDRNGMETEVVNLRLAIVAMIISTINNMTVIKIID
jgi:hypothetical protein